jgi:methylthioribose-1-phosphate isomerase
MAGFLFSKDMVKEVWIAYDGKDEEGLTVAIGGSILSILATRHQVPVFAFRSDKKTPVLADKNELLNFQGRRIAPKGAKTYAPLVEHVEHKFFTNVID